MAKYLRSASETDRARSALLRHLLIADGPNLGPLKTIGRPVRAQKMLYTQSLFYSMQEDFHKRKQFISVYIINVIYL